MGKKRNIYELNEDQVDDGRNIYRPDKRLTASQSRIAELEAEVERLTSLVEALTERVDWARGGADNAHNAAIEKAASLFSHPDEEGIADRIRDLKR